MQTKTSEEIIRKQYPNQPVYQGRPLCLYCHRAVDKRVITEQGLYCSVRCHTLDTME